MAKEPHAVAAEYLRTLSRQQGGADASDQAIETLCAQAPPVTFAAGDVVFREGEVADRALLVVEGRLRATLQGRPMGETSAGDVVGEAAIFVTAGRRSATVTAAEPTTCLVLTRELVRSHASNPALVALEVQLLHLLVRRIAETDALLLRAWREAAADKVDVRERLWPLPGGGS